MEYMTPNFTKDMVKTHKILIPNMAVTQFRLLQAALECEGYNVEVLGNCGSEVAQLGLLYTPDTLFGRVFPQSEIPATRRCWSSVSLLTH